MKSNFVKSPLYDLDTKTVDKSKIVPSSSAFTSDIGHIKGFGVDTTSPFKVKRVLREREKNMLIECLTIMFRNRHKFHYVQHPTKMH